MKLTNLSIRDLFDEDAKLTFLVGAGCSMDPPSCLPTGEKMMKAIIEYTCAEPEIKKILELDDLRFEQLVEIVRDRLDKELKMIDFYGLCDKPNVQHFFFADMIEKGNFVITTNFDALIELALLKINTKKEEIISVITKSDFEKFNNPEDLYAQGKKVVYKIHGSPKNIITQEDTKDSLIATIQAFGTNKKGLNVFQVEPFKTELFENISAGRTLIVMGYSGSDDFDIVPTLKVLKKLENIIWISHNPEGNEKEEIIKIEEDLSIDLDKTNEILIDIKVLNKAINVYRVNAHTSMLIENFLNNKYFFDENKFSLKIDEWLLKFMPSPNEYMKYGICYKIYSDFNMFDDAMRCSQKMHDLSVAEGNFFWKYVASSNIAGILYARGNYQEALKKLEETIKITRELSDPMTLATELNNIGTMCRTQDKNAEGLKYLEEALQIINNLDVSSKNTLKLQLKAKIYNNIGMIHVQTEDHTNALKYFEMSLQLDDQVGNLLGKAIVLNNIGMIYSTMGNHSNALKYYNTGLKIVRQLKDMSNESMILNNLGSTYHSLGNYPEAIKLYRQAIIIANKLGDLSTKGKSLNNIGEIYRLEGNNSEALKNLNEALLISRESNNLSFQALVLSNIGVLKSILGDDSETLKWYNEALRILEQSDSQPSLKLKIISSIGKVYYNQGDLENALKNWEVALNLADQLNDLPGKALMRSNLGFVFQSWHSDNRAINYFEESLVYARELQDDPLIFIILNNMGLVYRILGNETDSIKCYEEALKTQESQKKPQEMGNILSELGFTYYLAGNFSEAIKKYKEALKIDDQLNNINKKLKDLNRLGEVFIDLKDFSESLKIYEEALHILKTYGLSESPDAQDIKSKREYLKTELKKL